MEVPSGRYPDRMWLKIAIDGPAGSGKSSVSSAVARKRGLVHIDSGSCYRAICYRALQWNVNLLDEAALTHLAHATDLQFRIDPLTRGSRIFMEGEDVTPAVRRPEVEAEVAKVARVSGVRKRVVGILKNPVRDINEVKNAEGMIMDGRDIGSVVWPDAHLKIFLKASLSTRAQRRYKEFMERRVSIGFKELVRQIQERDRVDRERKDSPLVLLPEAEVIDSTFMSMEEVIGRVDELIESVKSRYFSASTVAVSRDSNSEGYFVIEGVDE